MGRKKERSAEAREASIPTLLEVYFALVLSYILVFIVWPRFCHRALKRSEEGRRVCKTGTRRVEWTDGKNFFAPAELSWAVRVNS